MLRYFRVVLRSFHMSDTTTVEQIAALKKDDAVKHFEGTINWCSKYSSEGDRYSLQAVECISGNVAVRVKLKNLFKEIKLSEHKGCVLHITAGVSRRDGRLCGLFIGESDRRDDKQGGLMLISTPKSTVEIKRSFSTGKPVDTNPASSPTGGTPTPPTASRKTPPSPQAIPAGTSFQVEPPESRARQISNINILAFAEAHRAAREINRMTGRVIDEDWIKGIFSNISIRMGYDNKHKDMPLESPDIEWARGFFPPTAVPENLPKD